MKKLATLILLFNFAASANAQDFKVTLLGTGDPKYQVANTYQAAGIRADTYSRGQPPERPFT